MSRPYGWAANGTLIEAEAAVLREAAAAVLDGQPVSQVVRDFRDRGITSSEGRPWTVTPLTRALRNPRIIGYKADRRTGELVPRSDVDPILAVDQFEALVAVFDDPARKKATPKSRSSLLTGLVRCSTDGAVMSRQAKNYRCSVCPMSMSAGAIDAETSARVIGRLGTPVWQAALAGAMAADVSVWREKAREVDDRIVVLAEVFGAAGDRAALDAGVAAARQARADAEAGLGLAALAAEVGGLSVEQIVAWWEGASIGSRRSVAAAVLEAVVVLPVGDGLRGEDRLQFQWR